MGLVLLAAACGGVVETPVTPVAPAATSLDVGAAALPSVRISEIHYDNAGADANERVEISGPAGTNLAGWTLALYNGNPTQRNVYSTVTLTGTIPATCGARGVLVFATPGIQNGGAGAAGEPDGLALVNGSTVIEFLSYEGSFTAASGPAAGMTSANIGVFQNGSEDGALSLQRTAAGDNTWNPPATHTFGQCNDDGGGTVVGPVETVTISGPTTVAAGADITLTALAEDAEGDDITAGTIVWSDGGSASVTITPSANGRTATVHGDAAGGPVTITATLTLDGRTRSDEHAVTVTGGGGTPSATNVRISEIHYDDDGTDAGEAIEVEGDAGGSLAGWSLVLYTGSTGTTYATFPLSGTLASSCSGRGVLHVATPGIQNGGTGASEPDGVALVDNTGAVVEFLSYEGSFAATNGVAAGRTSVNIGVDEDPAPVDGQSLQRALNGVWFGPAAATFGSCNAATPPPPPASFVIIGRNSPSAGSNPDPALPIGYQDQLFAQSPPGTTLPPSGVTWSVDPATPFATVDAEGVVTGIAQGTATIRATRVSDGAVATYSLPVANPPDGPATYGNHLEFGRPVALSPRDEIAVAWPEFSASYNPLRGQSNWIAYNLDSDDRGPADRCECFTHDPSLPGTVPVISTDDYTGSGFSRGHLVMSEDRTSGGSSSTPVQTSIDNARTFLFSNIIPQTSANNGGPWLDLESHLGALATTGGKEVYILAGGAAYSGTLKSEGKVAIPTRTWKVAVILPDGQGLSSIDDPSDFEIIAVDMPNATSGLSSSWETYRVSVDQVEALIGYDLLAALPDAIECRVEQAIVPVANCAPEAAIQTTAISGRTVTVAARFRDGETTDGPWRVSINWGDGTAPTTATSFVQTWNAPLSRAHTYAAGGTFTITLTVVDKGGRTTTTQTQVTIP